MLPVNANADDIPEPAVQIVSWMGGEHWYIGERQFLRLEEAIAARERQGVEYELITICT